ncbi:MAG: SpoIIE family protein phosphatase [Chloroflexota bacterium]
MTAERQFNLWRHLSRTQISLGFTNVLLLIAVVYYSANLYFNITTTNEAFQAGYLVTDLSDIERVILRLQQENNQMLRKAEDIVTLNDLEPVELQRALLNSQMRLALNESVHSQHLAEDFDRIQASFEVYTDQLDFIRDNFSPETVISSGPELTASLDTLNQQIRSIINKEENLFFNTISQALRSQASIQTTLIVLSVLFLAFATLLVLSLQRTISKEYANAYHRLREEVSERRQAEIELRLSDQDLRMVNQDLQVLNERLQDELKLAWRIQQSLLPPPRPNWPNIDVACYSIPALQVGGDFYAYQARTGERYAVAVGDVSGKGASAALLMATSLAHFDSVSETDLPPDELLMQLDQSLIQYTETTQQNCAFCYVELNGLQMQVVNAGCISPYIRRATGGFEEIEIGGAPLGLGLGATYGYRTLTLELQPGDQIIMTSDQNDADQPLLSNKLTNAWRNPSNTTHRFLRLT